jgi:hypothetical protein
MTTARAIFDNGETWWEIRDDAGGFVETVDSVETARKLGCKILATEEPTFTVRDDSGRGFFETVSYLGFPEDEREYFNEDEEEESTFGEWLDSASVGDTYKNEEQNFTVTRIS